MTRFGLRVPIDRIPDNRPSDPQHHPDSPFAYCESEREHIRQSIVMILRTRPGTRPLLLGYGCRVHELLFRPNSPALRGQAAFFVAEALRAWEQRVEVLDVSIGGSSDRKADPFTLRVRIEYRLRRTAEVDEVQIEYGDGIATLGPTIGDRRT